VVWGLADQVVSSAANFLVVVLVARSLDPAPFGAFTIAFGVCIMTTMLARGVTSDLLASMHSGDSPSDLRWAIRAGLTTSLAVALSGSVLAVVVGASTSGAAHELALAAALVLPGVLAQDYLRVALIVEQRPRAAFLNDATWAVIQVPLLVAVAELGGGSAAMLVAWGGAGILCAAIGLAQVRVLPLGPRTVRDWLRHHRTLWPYLVLDNGIGQAGNVGIVLAMALVANLAQVGALRVAMTVFAPLSVMGRGTAMVAVPELVRRHLPPRATVRAAGMIGITLAPLAGLWAVLALALPDRVWEELFGATWASTRPLVLLTAVSVAGGLFSVGIFVGLRTLAAGRQGLLARTTVTGLLLIAGVAGGAADGARGAAAGLAVVTPLQAAVWWWLVRRAAQERESMSAGTSPASTSDATLSSP
jgi:O-antigen/teichoic acid export membrane protein